jgi:hypothetical protein
VRWTVLASTSTRRPWGTDRRGAVRFQAASPCHRQPRQPGRYLRIGAAAQQAGQFRRRGGAFVYPPPAQFDHRLGEQVVRTVEVIEQHLVGRARRLRSAAQRKIDQTWPARIPLVAWPLRRQFKLRNPGYLWVRPAVMILRRPAPGTGQRRPRPSWWRSLIRRCIWLSGVWWLPTGGSSSGAPRPLSCCVLRTVTGVPHR